MNPFFFGESERALFGLYHPPRSSTVREIGVVLCYPMGQEYMRAHRAFRQLALILSKRGFHVLRFDYYATGDSAGEDQEGTLAQWRDDIGTTIDELKDTANVQRVAVVGLRVGASLAVAACRNRDDVQHIVMWDPVLDGGEYIEELLTSKNTRIDGTTDDILGGSDEGRTIGVMGFPMTATMRNELRSMVLLEQDAPAVPDATILVSQEREDCKALSEAFKSSGVRARYECIPSPGAWGAVDNNGSALIPQALIQGVVASLSGGR